MNSISFSLIKMQDVKDTIDIRLCRCRYCNFYWRSNYILNCPNCSRTNYHLILTDVQTNQLMDAVFLITVHVDDDDLEKMSMDDSESYKAFQFYNDILPMLPWYVPSRLMIQACWFSLSSNSTYNPQIKIAMDLLESEYEYASNEDF